MSTRLTITLAAFFVAGPAFGQSVAKQNEPIVGIGPVEAVKKVRGGFAFTEGPAADGMGNVYFTDIPNNRIHRLTPAGGIEIFDGESGHCNGLMVHKGRLLACEMDGRLKAYDLKSGKQQILAATYNDKRFNAPNDLVIDRTGGIYFTDPRFRAPDPWPQGKEAVYYRAADGSVTRLADNLLAPNGVILSPDEKTLYVIPSRQKQMYAYTVTEPGKISDGRVLCTLKQPEGRDNTGGDGLTVDTSGNLYITTGLGLQVFSPAGKLLGIVGFPEQPANVTFGGPDMKTIYVTARTSVYSVRMEAQGHVFPGN